MLLVVGLGNPGREYASHRHNVGFMVVDELADLRRAEPFRKKFSGEIARVELAAGVEAMLLKPQTYMNLSGDSVQPCAAFFKLGVGDVVVVHDECDLPFGRIQLKKGGGHAGHNGVRSLIQRLGSPDFVRLRIGVGRPPPEWRADSADWVLSSFSPEERAALPTILRNAADSVLDIAARGLEAAMKNTNTPPEKRKREGPKTET
jgi:PTH1 family peptidyl-tRNA hydrolase